MNNNRNCTSGLGTTTPSSLKRLSGDFQQMRPKNSSFKYNHSAGIVRNEKPFQCHHYGFYKALWLLVTEWNYTPSLATANGSDALMDESTTKAGEIHRYTDFSWTRVYGCALDTPAKKKKKKTFHPFHYYLLLKQSWLLATCAPQQHQSQIHPDMVHLSPP